MSWAPSSSGLLGRVVERGVRDPDLEEMEVAFLTVTTEEEVELDLDDFLRWDVRVAAVELSILDITNKPSKQAIQRNHSSSLVERPGKLSGDSQGSQQSVHDSRAFRRIFCILCNFLKYYRFNSVIRSPMFFNTSSQPLKCRIFLA